MSVSMWSYLQGFKVDYMSEFHLISRSPVDFSGIFLLIGRVSIIDGVYILEIQWIKYISFLL